MEQTRERKSSDIVIKIIAILSMLCDHTAAVFFPREMWMRCIGRLAFPLFAWGVAVGAKHTRDIRRYALRLLAVGILSQPFFMLALNHMDMKLNTFAVLLLGLIGCWGLKEHREYITVLCMLVPSFVRMDYGTMGVCLILMLYVLQDRPMWLAVCYAVFCAAWGWNTVVVLKLPIFPIRMQMVAFAALPLMLYPVRLRLRLPKWFTYAVYPVHLAILWGLKTLLLK